MCIRDSAYLNFLAGGTAVLATEEGEEAEATIRVTTHEGEASGASIDTVSYTHLYLEHANPDR